ncbi:MAG: hypothetical protein EOP45_20940 [Sphingobacteriaceae bacterium]|nr:MAG: hypothetical protein EOP45_20940 [Sphingobacteriaceae bacterium]
MDSIAITNNVENNSVQVTYIDSEQRQAPIQLKQLLQYQLQEQLSKELLFTEANVDRQTSNNCGPEMIENFVAYLTGERIESDFAVSYHLTSQFVGHILARKIPKFMSAHAYIYQVNGLKSLRGDCDTN